MSLPHQIKTLVNFQLSSDFLASKAIRLKN